MLKLPVIVGFGGVNAAGRASFHHGHNRMVFDALSQDKQRQTLQSLSALMGVEASDKQFILANSLIRKISDSHFDTTSIPWNRKIIAKAGEDQPIIFEAKAKSLPEVLPHNWTVQD